MKDGWSLPAWQRRMLANTWPEVEEPEHPMAILCSDGAWAGFDRVGDRITEWYTNAQAAWDEARHLGYEPFIVEG